MADQIDLDKSAKSSQRTASRQSPRKPGRPRKDSGFREKILDGAELAFAEGGFAGTSTRDIAARAGVNQGLIRYYFDTKQLLFEEVFRRRGGVLSGRRHVLLDRLLANNPNYEIEDVIRAYLQPQWDLKHGGADGAAFVRLQARIHAESEELSLRLRREVYDAAVKRYIDVIEPLLPHLPRSLISLRWSFLVGTYMFMLNDLGRIEDITEGSITKLSKSQMLDNLVMFLAAGLRAPAPE